MSSILPLSLLSAVVPLNSTLEGWTLLEPSTEERRRFEHYVSFEHAFSAPPVVQIGVVGVDADKGDNLRLSVRAESITATGFVLAVETWLHTRLWAVDVSWLAIGS